MHVIHSFIHSFAHSLFRSHIFLVWYLKNAAELYSSHIFINTWSHYVILSAVHILKMCLILAQSLCFFFHRDCCWCRAIISHEFGFRFVFAWMHFMAINDEIQVCSLKSQPLFISLIFFLVQKKKKNLFFYLFHCIGVWLKREMFIRHTGTDNISCAENCYNYATHTSRSFVSRENLRGSGVTQRKNEKIIIFAYFTQ